jgi:hypothetical protein
MLSVIPREKFDIGTDAGRKADQCCYFHHRLANPHGVQAYWERH